MFRWADTILVRILVVAWLLVLLVGGMFSFQAMQSARRVVRTRLLQDSMDNLFRVIDSLRLPPRGEMLRHLGAVAGGELCVRDEQTGRLVDSSFSPTLRRELPDSLSPGTKWSASLTLGGVAYAVEERSLAIPGFAACRLVLMVPESRLLEPMNRVRAEIIRWTLGTGAAATLLAALLAYWLARPVRRLTKSIAAADQSLQAGVSPGDIPALVAPRHPRELRQLGEAFGRLKESLLQAESQLAGQERLAAIGKMTAAVVHELRNPLSAIRMNLRLLRDETPADSAGLIGPLDQEIQRCHLYLEELAVLARSGEQPSRLPEVAFETFDLRRCLSEVACEQAGRFAHLRQRLDLRLPESLPPVRGSSPQVAQVLRNLLRNAQEAGPAGQTITLSAEAARQTVRVSVRDEGSGVASPQSLFAPFVSTKPRGAGLGLYLSRQIVLAHGGQMGYREPPGEQRGAEFFFTLPCAEIDGTAETHPGGGR